MDGTTKPAAAAARTVSLAEQLAEVNREIGLREHFYPIWVGQKRMKQDKADRCLEVMRAVRDTIADLNKQQGA